MTSKQLRAAQADLQVLLKSSELMSEIQAMKSCDFMERLRREVRTPSGYKVCFSDRAAKSFERISSIADEVLPSRELVEAGDIAHACKAVLGRWYEEGVADNIGCFFKEVEGVVLQSISVHKFYSSLSGLEFKDLNELKFGDVIIHRPSLEVLESSVAQEIVISSAWKEMNYGLWLTVEVKGSPNHAERRFFEIAKATCGLLSLAFTTCLDRGGAAVRLIPSVEGRFKPGAVTWFSVNTSNQLLSLKTSFDGFQALEFTEDHATTLLDCEWFQELVRISQSDTGNDAERALRRGLYWFFDAQADTSVEMKFVKYWSCIECMFSISKNKVVNQIRNGLTAVLSYGRYQFSKPESWRSLDSRVICLYNLRCNAVHDAQHDHVASQDVIDVSKWAAFVLMEVSMMISRGMESRLQLKEEIGRIQQYHSSIGVVDVAGGDSTFFKNNYAHFEVRFNERGS